MMEIDANGAVDEPMAAESKIGGFTLAVCIVGYAAIIACVAALIIVGGF